MPVKEIRGNISDIPLSERDAFHIERVYVSNEDLAKRLHAFVTDHGNEVNVHLPQGQHLHVGDILVQDGHNMVVVEVLEEDILVISPRSIREMGEIAHALGNRHLPAQFTDSEMLVQYDYLVENLLDGEKIPYQREEREIATPFRHIGHSND